jgi:hypothetical protein
MVVIKCRFYAGFGWCYGIWQEWVQLYDVLMTPVRLHNNYSAFRTSNSLVPATNL